MNREPGNEAAGAPELDRELEQSQRELAEQVRLNTMLGDSAEEFVGTLAHDLKNPLAAIKINVQAMKRTIERGAELEPQRWLDRLARIEAAVEQTLEQIAAARARVSSNFVVSQPLRHESLDLVELVGTVVEHYRQLTGQQRVRVDCRDRAIVGSWDIARLREALSAVIDNALKFSPSPDPVTVAVQRDQQDGHAVVRCSDRGIGIPERDLMHVCERFYRGENVVGRYKGAGIGLFSARGAVTAHGGSLTIESSPDRGCTVTLRPPLH